MSARHLRTAAIVAVLLPLALQPHPASAQGAPARTITWNTYLGGSAADGSTSATDDAAYGILSHRDGEVYVAGSTNAPRFPGSLAAPRAGTSQDAFVTKYDVSGGVVWTRLFGGAGNDVARRVVFNHPNEQHMYVVGTTSSASIDTGVPVPTGHGHHGGKDAFLARLELNGTLSWFMYLGGTGDDEGHDVAMFPDEQVAYVVGTRAGEAFITKVDISSSGPTILWTTTFGSTGLDEALAVATTPPYHQLYVGGVVARKVSSSSVTMPTPLIDFGGGESDGFLTRMNPADGTLMWFEYLGGANIDDVRDILHQPFPGGITIIGNTLSTNFPPKDPRPGEEIYMLRVDDKGALLQQKRIGAGGERMDGHASADSKGNIYVGGRTTSTTLARKAFDTTLNPGAIQHDAFVAMVDWALTRLVWASYVGGPTDTTESVRGLAASPTGTLTFVGHSTADKELLQTGTGADLTANGGEDAFVFRLLVDTSGPVAGTVSGMIYPNSITASWSGFSDAETDVNFEVILRANGIEQANPIVYNLKEPSETTTYTFNITPKPGVDYRIELIARNLFDESVTVSTGPLPLAPPDTSNPGEEEPEPTNPGPGPGAGPGTDPGQGDDEAFSPLGWSCGSTGDGSLAGLVLLTALALLSTRRNRTWGR
ncbi:hypothetical protein ACN28I_12240 [Archangium gephyra]|uniref:hypothetical protein n=1 Tax=Archangium gephyra TaxID=48 RepID=UPI003B79B895